MSELALHWHVAERELGSSPNAAPNRLTIAAESRMTIAAGFLTRPPRPHSTVGPSRSDSAASCWAIATQSTANAGTSSP